MATPAVVIRTAVDKRMCTAVMTFTVFKNLDLMLDVMPNVMTLWDCREDVLPGHDVLMLPRHIDHRTSFHLIERKEWPGSHFYKRDRFAFPIDAKKPFSKYPEEIKSHLEILLSIVITETANYRFVPDTPFSINHFNETLGRWIYGRIYSSGLIAKTYNEVEGKKEESAFGGIKPSHPEGSWLNRSLQYKIKKKTEPAKLLTEILRREASPRVHGKGLDLLHHCRRSTMEKYREEHGQPDCPLAKVRNRKIADNLRSRTTSAIKGGKKAGSAVRDLGCSVDKARQHLEAQFTGDMCWDNYGTYWHMDHFYPLSKANLADPVQFKAAAHYSNLRPMKARPNIQKSATVLPEAQKLFDQLCEQFAKELAADLKKGSAA